MEHHIPGTSPAHEHGHPSSKQYIIVAVILTVITAIEVAIYYIPAIAGFLVPLLTVLALGKFVLVVGYYMHLKFDHRLFTWLLVGGLITAIAMLTGLWALFNGFGG